jgi:Tol biopolymer transport system component
MFPRSKKICGVFFTLFLTLAFVNIVSAPLKLPACEAYPTGKILFVAQTYSDGYSALYVMNSNGSNATRLTNDSLPVTTASWSPEGSRIVFGNTFEVEQEPNVWNRYYEIYVANADGSNLVRLADNTTSGWCGSSQSSSE